MKYVQWVGGTALVGAVALTAILAVAAIGDVLWIEVSPQITLNGAQRTQLGNCVTAVFPAANTNNVREFYCLRQFGTNEWFCELAEEKTATVDTYVGLELNDQVSKFIDETGGTVTYYEKGARVQLTGAAKNTCGTFYHSIWSRGATANESADLAVDVKCERPAGDVLCYDNWVNTGTKAAYIAAKKNGVVVGDAPIGEVTE